jgi:acyl carrier protein
MDNLNTVELVLTSLNTIIAEMDEEDRPKIRDFTEDTRLIGKKAVLDSLNLVSMIVDIEQRINDDYGFALTIADERAMSQERSPFRTVGSLAEYILQLIEEQR